MIRINVLRIVTFFGALLLISNSLLEAQDWVRANGIPAIPIIAVAKHEGALFALSLDSVYRSTDGGQTWGLTPGQQGLSQNLMAIASSGSHLYLGTMNKGVQRTSDGGDHWEDYSQGLPGSAATALAVVGDSLYAGTDAHGIFVRNTALPSAWAPYSDGLQRVGVNIIGFGHDMLLATVGGSVYARRRGGLSWSEVLFDSARGQVTAKCFRSSGEYLFAGVGTGVYRGSSDARSWEKVDIPLLPNLAVEHLATVGTRLLAGVRFKLEHFIAYTDNAGMNWGVLYHELAELLAMDVIDGRLYACRADGLWSIELSPPAQVDLPVDHVPHSYQLAQNFPNPFNPSTTISYALPYRSHVILTVFNTLGQPVATLVNSDINAGYHSVQFNAAHLASGVYLYRLQAGSYIQTKKLCLLQ